MGALQGGMCVRWELCQVGALPGGSSVRWELCQVGTLPGGSSTRWELCQVGAVQGGNSVWWELCQVGARCGYCAKARAQCTNGGRHGAQCAAMKVWPCRPGAEYTRRESCRLALGCCAKKVESCARQGQGAVEAPALHRRNNGIGVAHGH